MNFNLLLLSFAIIISYDVVGSKEYLMRAHFGLPSITSEDNDSWKAPIEVKFEIPYFTVSGIQVRYLKILEKSGYDALPWVRYLVNSGEYNLRMNSNS